MADAKDKLALPAFAIKKAAKVGTPKSILIYGPPKKGKTVFAASICRVPGFERTLLIDVEGGASSVSAWYPEVDVIEAGTPKEFAKIIEALIDEKLVEPESGLPYQAVIIDTLDKAQERQLEEYGRDPRRFAKGGAEDGFWKWGMLKPWTSKLGDVMHMAPFLTIFLAHEDDHKEENGPVLTTVLLAGKSRLTFPSTPDIIGRFGVRKVEEDGKKVVKRLVDFSLSEKLITGQRYADKLDGQFLDPTFERIFKAIEPERFETATKTTNN